MGKKSRIDGKSLRVGGNPHVEKDWEFCTQPVNCKRHTHPDIKINARREILQQILQIQHGQNNPRNASLTLEEYETFTDTVGIFDTETASQNSTGQHYLTQSYSPTTAKQIIDNVETLLQDSRIVAYNEYYNLGVRNNFEHFITLLQNPKAGLTATRETWAEQGRKVKPKKLGIFILKGTKLQRKYDISDTEPITENFNTQEELDAFKQHWEGKHFTVEVNLNTQPLTATITAPPTSSVQNIESEAPTVLKEYLMSQVSQKKATIRYGEVDGGYNGLVKKKLSGKYGIQVRDSFSEGQQMSILAHEITHIKLKHTERPLSSLAEFWNLKGMKEEAKKEIITETIAHLLCQKYGLNTASYTLPYITEWSTGDNQLLAESVKKAEKLFHKLFN